LFEPPLTAVLLPYYKIGRKAAEIVVKKSEKYFFDSRLTGNIVSQEIINLIKRYEYYLKSDLQ